MSTSTYSIKGVPLVSGAPLPTRKEITAWYSDEENALQVSLFILALTRFQSMDPNDQLSYFRVAGIHGEPRVSWDGETGGFFCNHNMVTFPTWHRPYLLLFEQRVFETMLEIITEEVPPSEQESWKTAALQWRLPYWDWALIQPYLKNYGVPEICTLPDIEIIQPKDKTKAQVKNPLYKFSNPSGKAMGDPSMGKYAIKPDTQGNPPLPWDKYVGTSRYGIVNNSKDWTLGVENWQESNDALQNPEWYAGNTGTIGELVYRLFTPGYFKSWEAFASTKMMNSPGAQDYMSVEYLHNNIHSFTGGVDPTTGLGQMCDPPVAAFDPIFFLHHCNVDRQIAIFQTLNPGLWFDHPQRGDPKSTAPLRPFHFDGQQGPYTSEMVKDWTKLNYTYDVLVPPSSPNGSDAVTTEAVSEVSPKTLASASDGADQNGNHGQVRLAAVSPSGTNNHPSIAHLKRSIISRYACTRQDLSRGDISGKKNDYIINVIYDRYALNGRSYTLYFFLGDAPSEVSQYRLAKNRLGTVFTFSSKLELDGAEGTQCHNCVKQKEDGVLSMAQIPITSALLKDAMDDSIPSLSSLEPDADRGVKNYLVSHLNWKAVAVGGVSIPMSDLPKTKIFVMNGVGDHPEDQSQFSQYHSYRPMWEVTTGKPGGCESEDRGLVHY